MTMKKKLLFLLALGSLLITGCTPQEEYRTSREHSSVSVDQPNESSSTNAGSEESYVVLPWI